MVIDNAHRGFLLFMEPTKSASDAIVDGYTKKMTGAFRKGKEGASGYSLGLPHFLEGLGSKGWHTCECAYHAMSSNKDSLLRTTEANTQVVLFKDMKSFSNGETANTEVLEGAVITNSLCIHYVACHREEIPVTVLKRIMLLVGEPADPTEEELMAK